VSWWRCLPVPRVRKTLFGIGNIAIPFYGKACTYPKLCRVT
jgi:hypothetical protein